MPDKPPYDLAERTFRFACAIVRFTRKLSQQPGIVKKRGSRGCGSAIILEEHLAPAAEVLPLLDEANQLVAIFTASNKRLKLGAIVRAPFVGVLILFAGPISAF